jgi:hypothetical protein
MRWRNITSRQSPRAESTLFDRLGGGDKQHYRMGKPGCGHVASKRLDSPHRSGRSTHFGRSRIRKASAVTREVEEDQADHLK